MCRSREEDFWKKNLAFIAHMAPTHDALEVLGHTFYFLYSSYPRDPANQKIVKIVLKVFKKKLEM